jgi:hypothetical protein
MADSKHRANSTFHNQNVFIVRVSSFAFEFRHKSGNNEIATRCAANRETLRGKRKKNGNLIEDFVGGGGGRTKRNKASQTKASNCREVQSKVETWRNRLRQ